MPLKAFLDRDVKTAVYNPASVALIVLSGTIQALSLAIGFFTAMVILAAITTHHVFDNYCMIVIRRAAARDAVAADVKISELAAFAKAWFGAEGPLLGTIQNGGQLPPVSSARERLVNKNLAAIVLCGWAGTLIWMSVSLFFTSGLVSAELTLTVQALSSFSMLMSAAFTTSLVAALLEFPLSCGFDILAGIEASHLKRCERFAGWLNIQRLHNLNKQQKIRGREAAAARLPLTALSKMAPVVQTLAALAGTGIIAAVTFACLAWVVG